MHEQELIEIVTGDPVRRTIIAEVAALELPEAWIAGGFVRNAVWDALYGKDIPTPINDVDVVYFKKLDAYGEDAVGLLEAIRANEPNPVWKEEENAQHALEARIPGFEFEVKNQARMHLSSARLVLEEPYQSMSNAVAGWVETATATGIRMNTDGSFSVLAPYGLEDLFNGIVRPTRPAYDERAKERAATKGWFSLWPTLKYEDA